MRRAAALPVIFLLAFMAAAVQPSHAVAANGGGWFYYDGSGHWYTQLNEVSWADAEGFAVANGGHLVTINDGDEQSWLHDTFPDRALLIGMNDFDAEGIWVWTSGETDPWDVNNPTDPPYTDWSDGEPNDLTDDSNPVGEDVAVMNWGEEGEWNDLDPRGLFSAIIELPDPIPAPGNDDLANATEIWDRSFDDAPSMGGATREDGEMTPCAPDAWSHTVWYRFTTYARSGALFEVDGDEGGVTAAIYGPFQDVPASVEDLYPTENCIHGTGRDQAGQNDLEPGVWLVQLASADTWETPPTIHIEQGFAYFWIDSNSISLDAATVDRSGTITFTGTAVCQFQHWSGGLPEAYWGTVGDNEGFWYELQGGADQSLGRKTLLQGGGWGQIGCTYADQDGRSQFWFSVRAENGKFGPNWTNMGFSIGGTMCDESGCWFQSIADFGSYLKIKNAH